MDICTYVYNVSHQHSESCNSKRSLLTLVLRHLLIGKVGDRRISSSVPSFTLQYPGSRQPWSRTPTHLFNTPPNLPASTRMFSSSLRRRGDNGDKPLDGMPPQSPQKPSLVSSFGFQSLTGLFQEEPKGRYSRPKPDADSMTVNKSGSAATDPTVASVPAYKTAEFLAARERTKKVDAGFFSPQSVPQITTVRKHVAGMPLDRSILTRRQRQKTQLGSYDSDARVAARSFYTKDVERAKAQVARTLDPFRRGNAVSSASKGEDAGGKEAENAWGIGEGAMRTIDSITDPDASMTAVDDVSDSHIRTRLDVKSSTARLTHVKSTGEAHMVDVGAKPSTRRAAVAHAIVSFSNAQPFQLILENNNKKGDVLGVARIAGIMAAKRTPDLIPLCHPLAISKVELDANINPPTPSRGGGARQISPFGGVELQALVETVGPTGVEMEALTAVVAAALTVVDMCKAVDREMVLGEARVVYKMGGNSGVHLHQGWARKRGLAWLAEKGLEFPEKDRARKKAGTEAE
jgi:molybdenum cofactor biosynthesis protein MoaC